MKETNKLILVAIIPSIFTFVLTSVASSSLQQIGDSIADSFSKKKPYAQAQIEPSDTILENDSFILTADGSIDPDGGRIISYTWLQNNGHGFEALRLSETNKSTANFAAPNVINDTPLSFKLIVKDDEGSENNANVTVTIKPHHPFRKEWGEHNHFNGTAGIAAENLYGSVFVVDRNNHQIQKFDNDGDFITKWGGYGNGNGSLNNPSGIAIDENWKRRYVFVADSGNDRIQKFEEWSGWNKTWGSFCDIGRSIGCIDPDDSGPLELGDGQFHYPTGVAVDKDGNVYVADSSNHRIQKFTNNGTFITKWGSACILQFLDECVDPDGSGPLELGDSQFFDPRGIAVDKDGNVYVVDKKNSRVQKFDANGTFITKWSSTSDGKFDPEYIAIGPETDSDSETERVYVTDVRYKRVDEFDANGTFIRKWGIPLLENPAGIAISPIDPYKFANCRNGCIPSSKCSFCLIVSHLVITLCAHSNRGNLSESIKKVGIPLAATIAIAVTAVVVVTSASSLATPASAQLQCSPDVNPAGNQPPGQQACTCPPLTQCTENVNPAGNQPPGKNK